MQSEYKLKACDKCKGDLTLDEGDWRCVQCGNVYYTEKPIRYKKDRNGHTLSKYDRRLKEYDND